MISSLVFINDNMRFIISSSLSSNVRTNIFPYDHFQSDNKILLKKLIEIFLLIVLCFHIEITLHHNIFICDFHICSSVQCFSCITRIKDITLSYTFPQRMIQKMGIGGLQLYVSGRNLFTFTDWVGWDPEARQVARGNSSWDSTRGETVYDSSNYPMTKSCVFGVNLTF